MRKRPPRDRLSRLRCTVAPLLVASRDRATVPIVAFRLDTAGTISSVEATPQGGLRVRAHVTRTGVLEYVRADGSIRREYRPPDEVFAPSSLATLDDAPFTVMHPRGLVRPDAYHDLAVGHVRNPRQDDRAVEAIVVVQAEKGLKAIRSGLREVSCGYECRTDETPGVTPEGEQYDAIQRDIKYNHVSLVPRGRAGKSVRLRMDGNGDMIFQPVGTLMIRIDDIDYPLESEADQKAASAALARYAAKRDAEVASEKARADEALAKVASFEAAEKTRKDALVKEATSKILGKEGSQKDVIAKVLPSVKLDGRSDAEIEVLFDAAVAHFEATATRDDGVSRVRTASAPKNDARQPMTADAIRLRAMHEAREAHTKPLSLSKQ